MLIIMILNTLNSIFIHINTEMMNTENKNLEQKEIITEL